MSPLPTSLHCGRAEAVLDPAPGLLPGPALGLKRTWPTWLILLPDLESPFSPSEVLGLWKLRLPSSPSFNQGSHPSASRWQQWVLDPHLLEAPWICPLLALPFSSLAGGSPASSAPDADSSQQGVALAQEALRAQNLNSRAALQPCPAHNLRFRPRPGNSILASGCGRWGWGQGWGGSRNGGYGSRGG